MRLREPFSGYKLTQGHYMFHVAFLLGSYLEISYGHHVENEYLLEASRILHYLRLAHILVPFFQLIQCVTDRFQLYSVSRVFEIISIF